MTFSFPTANVLNCNPLVLAMYDSDFEKRHVELSATIFAAGMPDARIIIQIGFEHETDDPADKLASAIHAFLVTSPAARVVVICNSPNEEKKLRVHGLDARFCHQNAFLDERRYRVVPMRKCYDAVYLARVTPFKRHLLLEGVTDAKLLMAGACWSPLEKAYVEDVHKRLVGATFMEHFRGCDASLVLCQATCGLCLSAREGAMFGSAECLLSGLPLVNTPALGGREQLFPEGCYIDVEATPDAISQGIAKWVAETPNPHEVRAAFLRKAEVHREKFREIFAELSNGAKMGRIPHKLGIRTPPGGELRVKAIQLYLQVRGMIAALRK